MKASIASAVVAYAAVVSADGGGPGWGGPGWGGNGGNGGGYGGPFGGNGWGGGPVCASSCFSSYWATATPTPSAFCTPGAGIASCVSSACATDSAALSTYTSISSSVCSQLSVCSSSGTFTYTYGTGPSNRWGGSTWTGQSNWPTGTVTVTGCPWDGQWGWGPAGGGGNWGDKGPGWTYATRTTLITTTFIGSNGLTTSTGLATVAQAVSGESTEFTTFTSPTGVSGNQATNTPNAAPSGDLRGVKVMGAALGAVVAVAGLM